MGVGFEAASPVPTVFVVGAGRQMIAEIVAVSIHSR